MCTIPAVVTHVFLTPPARDYLPRTRVPCIGQIRVAGGLTPLACKKHIVLSVSLWPFRQSPEGRLICTHSSRRHRWHQNGHRARPCWPSHARSRSTRGGWARLREGRRSGSRHSDRGHRAQRAPAWRAPGPEGGAGAQSPRRAPGPPPGSAPGRPGSLLLFSPGPHSGEQGRLSAPRGKRAL